MTTDTRAAFESHFALSSRQAKKDNAGEYINPETRARWEGWQARQGQIGYKLAMRVLQSDLYRQLDDAERAECDEFIERGHKHNHQ